MSDKYDARALAPLTCCEGRLHPIYKVMAKLDDVELAKFRKDLLKYTETFHPVLENEFNLRLKKPKENKNENKRNISKDE
jgi:hypothetical protein